MTDLTEQWKKGKLESGWYYVQLIRGEYRIDLYIKDKNEWIDCPDAIIDAVVCAVPSYEEWQELKEASDGLSNLMFKSLMNRFVKADEERERLSEGNQQLKELLKECQHMIIAYSINHDTFIKEKVLDIVKQIDNAIGEK